MASILTIPCHWDKKIIKEIISYNSKGRGIRIGEIYGTLAKSPLRHGRASNTVPEINKTEAIGFKRFADSVGLKFNYLINAPLPTKYKSGLDRESIDYLKWVLFKFKPDYVTVSSLEIIKEIRKIDKNIKINISTIANIKSPKNLKKFIPFKISRVVPHHDVGKSIKKIKALTKFCEKLGITLELLATESCLYKCPRREAHYRYLANANYDKPFHTDCNLVKITNPAEFLMAGGTIRPEDIKFYESLGLNYFKITGRSKPTKWLPIVAKAYLERKYNGNLIRLLGADPSLKIEQWIYIDNKSLNGFLQNFPFDESDSEKRLYCNRIINKLYATKGFHIKDKSKYQFINNSLVLMTPGKIVKHKLLNR